MTAESTTNNNPVGGSSHTSSSSITNNVVSTDHPTTTTTMYKTHEGEHHGDFSDLSIKVTKSTFLYAFCAAMNSCNLGYDIGVSTNASQLIQNDFGLTDTQRELFVGSLNFFSIFGSATSHWICDRYGRRRSFQVAAVTFIIGLIIMSFSNGFTVLMIGRAILGLAVGFGLAIDPYVHITFLCSVLCPRST